MQIGVLGSGVTGQTIGSKLVQLGHEVMLGSRDEANPPAVAWAKDAGGQHAMYGTFRNAASFGEIVFNMVGEGLLGKTENDSREDFKNVYDFDVVFRQPFLPRSQMGNPPAASSPAGGEAQ